jgi:hypothetical protein|tara:strand:- start:1209 stop:1397 length:189 start_codon:yes stop_codon:yes gene_type:complete
MSEKIEFDIKIENEQLEWVESKVAEFDLDDASKVLRILLDYAILECNAEDIFSDENMRCRHC